MRRIDGLRDWEIRGTCKACGHMLPKCDAGGFHRHLDEIPPSEYRKFEPLVDRLESLAETRGSGISVFQPFRFAIIATSETDQYEPARRQETFNSHKKG